MSLLEKVQKQPRSLGLAVIEFLLEHKFYNAEKAEHFDNEELLRTLSLDDLGIVYRYGKHVENDSICNKIRKIVFSSGLKITGASFKRK